MKPFNVHATCVALAGRGVLIRGKPGSGKSELALRLIDSPGFGTGVTLLQGLLVADDQTLLEVSGGQLVARAPERLAGLMELRGQGLLQVPHQPSVILALVVDLLPATEIERLPEAADMQTEIAGVRLARIVLDQAQPAAPSVVRSILTSRLKLLPDSPQTA